MNIYFDGSGWNKRESKFCVVFGNGQPTIIRRFTENKTNNEMEYAGLLEALTHAKPGDEIFTDSQLIYHQVFTRKYRVKKEHIKLLAEKAIHLIQTKKVTLTWIPREQNKAGHVLENAGRRV
ncbi:MAG TPA: RNase H family protein [Candidatus Norongarragalinales archaeon]|nr:RNase H family protein [Candidatus Norongarragalinales archaeon]